MRAWHTGHYHGTLSSSFRSRAVQPASGPDQMSLSWHACKPLIHRQLGQVSTTASKLWSSSHIHTWKYRSRCIVAHNGAGLCPGICARVAPATVSVPPWQQLCTAAHSSLTAEAAAAAPAQGATRPGQRSRHLTQTVCMSAVRSTGNVCSGVISDDTLGPKPVRRAGYVTTHALHSAQAQASSYHSTPDYYREGVIKSNWAMGDDERAHWESLAARFKRDTAVHAVTKLDPKWRCGVSYERMGGLLIEGRKRRSGNAPSGSLWFRRAKTKHPLAVVLVRIGAFYETVGYDAAAMMEYGGYRPMGGRSSDLPRAGCPEAHLQQVLKQLVEEAGLTVAVWEEAPSAKDYGTRSKDQKDRLFVQLVTPDNPAYLYGFSTTNLDRDVEMPNIKGVSLSSTGFSVYELNRSSSVISVYKNLAQESVWSVLTADGSRNPVVYLHWPLDQPDPRSGPTASRLEKSYFSLQNQLKDNNARIRKYKSADPLSGFKQRVKQALDLPQDADLKHLPAWDATSHWPSVRPLYYSSLCQLGLGFSPGIPSLVAYLLPEDSGGLVHREMTQLLKNPPPHTVAAAIRRTLKLFESPDLRYWPEFDVSGRVKPEKLAGVLDAKEGNEKLFWDLHGALEPVIIALSSHTDSPVLSSLVDSIWPLLCHKMSCQPQELDRNKMLQAAAQAVADIKKVVVPTEHIGKGMLPQKPAAGGGHAAVQPSMEYWSKRLEKFRKRVNRNVLLHDYQQVEGKYYVLEDLADSLVYSLTQVAHETGLRLPAKELPYVHTDELNQSALIRLPSADFRQHMKSRPFQLLTCVNPEAALHERQYQPSGMQQLLQQPYDRNGAAYKHKDAYTCNHLDMLTSHYRDAVTTANEAATKALRRLSGKLASSRTELVAALKLGILLQTVQEHFKAAKNAGWSLPVVGREEQLQAGIHLDVAQRGMFRLQGLYPYWMRAGGVSAPVLNDLELDGFMLLTGPNMAGKSTVLRSAAAAALCGCVGLFIPAAPGSLLPELDAILLRTFTADAPIDRLSAFGMEMKEMACVLTDARSASLVLVDELGKGTEVAAGTSITAAMLQKLAETGAIGVFATHLHGVLEMQQDIPRLVNYSMEVVDQQTAAGHTRLVPTWRLSPGSCTKSLAFDVARDVGMPDDVMQMAEQDLQTLDQLGGYKALVNIAAGGAQAKQYQQRVASDRLIREQQHDRSDAEGEPCSSLEAAAQGDDLEDGAWNGSSSSNQSSAAQQPSTLSNANHMQHLVMVTELLTDLGNHAQSSLVTAAGSHSCSNSSASSSTDATHSCTVHHIWWREGNPDISKPKGARPDKAHSGAAALYAVWLEQTGCWQPGYTESLQDAWKASCSSAEGSRIDMWYVVLDTGNTNTHVELQHQLHQAMVAAGVPLAPMGHQDVVRPPPRRRRRKAAA